MGARGGRSRSRSRPPCSFAAAWQLNAWLMLAGRACVVAFYSYTKRFTRWSHLVLGVGLSIAPVGDI